MKIIIRAGLWILSMSNSQTEFTAFGSLAYKTKTHVWVWERAIYASSPIFTFRMHIEFAWMLIRDVFLSTGKLYVVGDAGVEFR